MTNKMMDSQRKTIIENYIHAKDGNRPQLMRYVFHASATLKMQIKTDQISFPADAVGLDAITDILVTNFSKSYEDVYTFCFSDSLKSSEKETLCGWLVAMRERDSGNIRVGCGIYNWSFDNPQSTLADSLTITINQMIVLKPEFYGMVTDWLKKSDYPWTDTVSMMQKMPELEPLNTVRDEMV